MFKFREYGGFALIKQTNTIVLQWGNRTIAMGIQRYEEAYWTILLPVPFSPIERNEFYTYIENIDNWREVIDILWKNRMNFALKLGTNPNTN